MPKISVLESSIFSTAEVARKARISENEAREWASELGVGKLGPAFAWTQSDLDALMDGLDAEAAESEDDDPDEEVPTKTTTRSQKIPTRTNDLSRPTVGVSEHPR